MKKTLLLFVSFLSLFWMMPISLVTAVQVVEGISPSVPFSHALWDATLNQSVSPQGWIDFSQLKAHPRVLNAYLDLLAKVSPENAPTQFKTPSEKVAYWLNAYNALLLRLTLDNYPTETAQPTVKPTPPWIGHYKLGGTPVNLAEVQAKAEAAGASVGMDVHPLLSSLTLAGPSLRNEAYLAETLVQQAEDQRQKPQPYQQLREETPTTCDAWIVQYIDRKKEIFNRYQPNARLPMEFPLPVPRPLLETTIPYSEKALFHYCLSPESEKPPSPLLLMDSWQLVP